MCSRKRSRPSSKRRLTKKLKRLSSGRSVCASAIGVVDEHRLRTNGPVLGALAAFGPASPPSAAARVPEAILVIGVISSPNQNHRQPGPGETADSRRKSGGARSQARSWRPRRHRNRAPFRPVALRPRLSTGLPLSLGAQSQIVADCSQALKMCPSSQVLSQIGDTLWRPSLCRSPFPLDAARARRRRRSPETASAAQTAGVETLREIRVGDRLPGAGRVNEATGARVDSDVIDRTPCTDTEKNQITRSRSEEHTSELQSQF